MSFLPSDYKDVPQGNSGYMKFKKGSNRFRILSPAIVGYEYWSKDNKPVRQEKPFATFPEDIKVDDEGNPTRINHFWAFIVYNYEEKAVQILEITQATIQRAMKIKIDNRKGDAVGYDFIITRSGDGLNTDYDIDTGNQEPVSEEITKAYAAKKVNLNALYSGGDPFAGTAQPAQEASQQTAAPTDEEVPTEDVPF